MTLEGVWGISVGVLVCTAFTLDLVRHRATKALVALLGSAGISLVGLLGYAAIGGHSRNAPFRVALIILSWVLVAGRTRPTSLIPDDEWADAVGSGVAKSSESGSNQRIFLIGLLTTLAGIGLFASGWLGVY